MTRSLLLEHKREIYDRYGREGLTGAGRWSGGVPAWEWVREGGAGKFWRAHAPSRVPGRALGGLPWLRTVCPR